MKKEKKPVRTVLICLGLFLIGLGVLLVLLKGRTVRRAGIGHDLSGGGAFSARAGEWMPALGELPAEAGIDALYRRESHLIESAECQYLRVELPAERLSVWLADLRRAEAEQKAGQTVHRPEYYMLPWEDDGTADAFRLGGYCFDRADMTEIPNGSSAPYIRLIGVNGTGSSCVFVFLRDDRGSSVQLDSLLRLNDFEAFAAENGKKEVQSCKTKPSNSLLPRSGFS